MYYIRINAIISQERWNNEIQEEYFEDQDWSVELECDENDLKKLLELNSKENFQDYDLPYFVQHHLQNSNEIDFNELYDKIKSINTRVISEIK